MLSWTSAVRSWPLLKGRFGRAAANRMEAGLSESWRLCRCVLWLIEMPEPCVDFIRAAHPSSSESRFLVECARLLRVQWWPLEWSSRKEAMLQYVSERKRIVTAKYLRSNMPRWTGNLYGHKMCYAKVETLTYQFV